MVYLRNLTLLLFCACAVHLVAGATAWAADKAGAEETGFGDIASPFFQMYCVRCHGAEKQEADFSVKGVTATFGGESLGIYEKALEMVSIGDMPPAKAPQPSKLERERFVGWVKAQLKSVGRGPDEHESAFPKYANYVNHEDLFSGKYQGPAYTPARVWRINASIYDQLLEDLDLTSDFAPPLNKLQGEGFDDYALLYADEAAIRTMMQNGKRVAQNLVHGRLVKPRGAAARDPTKKARRLATRHTVLAEFAALADAPSREQMDEVVRYTFDLLLHRPPTDEELERYVSKNLSPNVASGGADAGLRGLIVSMLLSPEFLFRMEMGLGAQLPDGRRMLSPHELAFALSYALHDHPVKSVMKAADEGRLSTRADVEREVRLLLDDDRLLRGRVAVGHRDRVWQVGKLHRKFAKPRMLRFFREFFDYAKAPDVFKDDLRHAGVHDARQLVEDADWLVLSVLAEDRDVLARLLTTDEFPVAYSAANRTRNVGYAAAYNITEPNWSTKVPLKMPAGQRAGILTHPAWLVAHSGNFDNDPVRRGKWIQEHLLAGVVPDVPIGVEAQLPEAPHHTLRQRFDVVRDRSCWRCHKKMNPLGEPFEIYDDFGRFRKQHQVTDDGTVLASDLELNRNQRKLKAQPKLPVDASGRLEGTGDPQLDGEVTDAIDLVHRLAASERVRQSFLRHVFRYWMGRNETLDDSPTLMAMDRAYVDSGGSFQETLVALFTSDSFLYRK